MNKKISQFEVTSKLNEHDLLTIVQDGTNKNITGAILNTSLSGTFATNKRVDGLEEDITNLDTKVDSNYTDLSNKIIEGDTTVTNNVMGTMNEYYDVLNNSIITLEIKHDVDMSEVNDTVQGWIDDIDNRSTLDQLNDALNKITTLENLITALAEEIASGGGSGIAPGFHTQSTATIFPLEGYYKTNDGGPLKTTDTLNQALAKLENQIDNVSSSSGSLPVIKSNDYTQASDGSIYTSLKTDKTFLKKSGDTASGRIIFQQGWQGGDIFRSGWDGQGASLYPVNTKWNLELDNLFVRGNMTVNELTVNEIKAVGGDILVTLGDMKCSKVEKLSDGYKCYFDDEDGTKYNSFVVNDMAICQQFDGKNAKRYWRKVNEIGSNYIVLSLDVCEPGSAEPQEGDDILQLGHMYEADPDYNAQMEDRRNAIFISAKGDNAPRITFYKGIDEFTLADDLDKNVIRERVVIGGDQTKFVGTIYQTSETGIKRIPIYQGKWVAGNTYYYYDQVTHNGSLWICMRPDGTTAEPSDTEDDWQKQVEKGEAGQPGDDVAKWVEVTGERLFLYETPDDSGIPTPERVILTATVHGMTNQNYRWIRLDTNTTVGTYSTLEVLYSDLGIGKRTVSYRCVVTNEDGSEYYDEIQLAKLFNGAEGTDAYYVDLSNSTVMIPYDQYDQPKINIQELYTDIYAYHGINSIAVKQASYAVTKGVATAHFDGAYNRIYLDTLESNVAEITLSLTLEDNYTVDKVWYIGTSKDGETGWNGEDAAYVTMSGEQYFHYKSGEIVPNPTAITISANSTNITNATYSWYYSLAGAYDWILMEGEVSPELVVRYDSVAMSIGDEVTFKCVVSNEAGTEYYDFMTINKVRDGENVYRGSLQNENCSIVTDENGNFTADAAGVAKTTSRLKYGNEEITDYTLSGWDKPYYGTGPSLVYDSTTRVLSYPASDTGAFRSDYLVYKIDFNYSVQGEMAVVDTVDFTITKSKQGISGEEGKQEVSIYRNSTSKPARYTGSTLPTGSTGSSWSLDAYYSSTTPTWVSKGLYDPNIGRVVLAEGATYLWTDPIKWSGTDGEPGWNGEDGKSPYISSDGHWYYYESGNWYRGPEAQGPEGSAGPSGPAIVYRGIWNKDKRYYWTEDRRDVVKLSSSSSQYYIAKYYDNAGFTNSTSPSSSSYWKAMSSFEMVATDLLLAQKANIAGWQFDPTGFVYSANNTICFNPTEPSITGDADDEIPMIAAGNGSAAGFTGTKVNPNAALKIYTNGTLTVGSGAVTSNAGITGVGGNAASNIRIWAGDTYYNRSSAPFRVNQGGDLVANKCSLTGSFQTSASGLRIVMSPQYSQASLVMQVYNTGGELVARVGSDTNNGFVGVYDNANNSTTVGSKHCIMDSTGFTSYYRNSSSSLTYAEFYANQNGLNLFCSKWPTSDVVSSGGVYKDANGYLKVK